MSNIPTKPISKLSILFLFLILSPGLILSYFSIQTIANHKELTEKRLLEEQHDLSSLVNQSFRDQLLTCATDFFQRIESIPKNERITHLIDYTSECIDQVFAIDNKKQFVWPFFSTNSKSTLQKSEIFKQAMAKAETSEFASSNLKKATEDYNNTLLKAKNEIERATAINGLARVLAKRGHTEQALTKYREILEKFGSSIDDNGIPFHYYSIHQFLRLTGQDNKVVLEYIDSILDRFIRGQLVLSNYTTFILQEILEWIERKNLNIKTEFLRTKIDRINKLIDFVNRDGSAIEEQVFKNKSSPTIGSFHTISRNINGDPSLLILNLNEEEQYTLGFRVNLEGVKEDVLQMVKQGSGSFEFQIEITSRDQELLTSESPFTTTTELSPLVPDWRIYIAPKNYKVIEKYIDQRRWIYGVALTFLIAGMFLGLVLVLRDVTREQRLAQLRSDFVSNVTHELKTPLTSIRMFAETMRLGRIRHKKEQQEYLTIIVNESERLTRLINTVLDFSRMERGRKIYRFESCNISDTVKSVLKAISHTINEHGFVLKSEVKDDIVTMADADAIEQAVLNLLSNAIKFSNKEKEIDVRLWKENNLIFLQVEDKGMGISETAQKHIFEKFYRAQTENRITGAGLGLPVVKHIVDAHKGEIKVESQIGIGSKFTIVLPKEEN